MNDHDHDHHQHESSSPELTFEEKISKLFDHWLQHNQSHAGTYREWGNKAREAGLTETADRLEEIAALTDQVSQKLEEAGQATK